MVYPTGSASYWYPVCLHCDRYWVVFKTNDSCKLLTALSSVFDTWLSGQDYLSPELISFKAAIEKERHYLLGIRVVWDY